jgi:pyruvate, orthophosphate dikinase
MTQGVLEQASAEKADSTSTKHVYFFGGGKAEGNGKMKDVLGGKGAGLAEMTNAGLPVPPGFTIQTEACREYMRGALSPQVNTEMYAALERWRSCKARSSARATIPCWFRFAPAPSSPCPA